MLLNLYSHLGGFVGYSVNLGQPHGSRAPLQSELTIGKGDGHLEQTAFPYRLVLARDTTLPVLQVQDILLCPRRLRIEAKGMIAAPLLPNRCQLRI